jgi:ATP-dependent Zn protease
MLGQRTRVGEHEAMRKIKNEFMSHWDGLTTKQGERILVLAATNRPFDLDEAIIRRFERRYLNYFKKLPGSIIVHGLNRRETDNLSTKLKIFS